MCMTEAMDLSSGVNFEAALAKFENAKRAMYSNPV